MEGPEFLKEKYDLHKSEEVETAAERTEQRAGEKVPQDPSARIQNYLDRLERLVLDPKKEQPRASERQEEPAWLEGKPRPRALSLLREMVMNTYVRPHKEKMARGAAQVEERAAREMGIEAQYGAEELEQRGDIAVEDLEKSLDAWILYLSDANEPYPTWLRYYAFRNILDIGDYDKEKGEFTRRSPGSFRLFPEIDRGALAYVQEMIEASKDPAMLEKLRKAQAALGTPEGELITQKKAVQFAKLSFAKQYAEGMRQAGEITPEMREETRGKWVKYQKGTDPTALWASLQNKGAAWCTKGLGTAEVQLKGGDFYVYYTYDKQGKPTIPRVAILMQEDTIGEVRGVADNKQNLEGTMVNIAEEKMKDLPGAERYKKASADMKQLTAVESKILRLRSGQTTEDLNKDELAFIYEINSPIEGFGYQRDSRIAELRSQRNPEKDMLVIFECTEEQIAHNVSEIGKNTKAYAGKLEPGIFTKIQEYNIEHIFTSFPEGRIIKYDIEIGGKDKKQLAKELKNKQVNVSDWANDLLESKDFTTAKESEATRLIRLTVEGLGFPQGATTDEIYKRAEELGLELCPAEAGPNLRLSYGGADWILIGMKQISDRSGYPLVFHLLRSPDDLWLGTSNAHPEYRWHPRSEFVFRLRKLENLET